MGSADAASSRGGEGGVGGGPQRSQELQTLAEQSRFSLTTVRVGGGSVALTHRAKN